MTHDRSGPVRFRIGDVVRLVVVWVVCALALELTALVLPEPVGPVRVGLVRGDRDRRGRGSVHPSGPRGGLGPASAGWWWSSSGCSARRSSSTSPSGRPGHATRPSGPRSSPPGWWRWSRFGDLSFVLTAGDDDAYAAKFARRHKPATVERPRRRRRGVRADRRRAVPGAAVGGAVGRRRHHPTLGHLRRLRPARVDAPAAVHDAGQPAGHPARHDRPGPGVPLVRPRARSVARRQPARATPRSSRSAPPTGAGCSPTAGCRCPTCSPATRRAR